MGSNAYGTNKNHCYVYMNYEQLNLQYVRFWRGSVYGQHLYILSYSEKTLYITQEGTSTVILVYNLL